MPRALDAQIRRLNKGDHVCLYYETPEEQLDVLTAYIRQGLARRERCLHVAEDARALRSVAGALTAARVNVERECSRGALVLLTSREAHLKDGRFNCEAMLGLLNDAVEQALNDGFSGLRTAGDMMWTLTGPPGADRVVEYEALMNEFYPDNHALGLCLYHRLRISPCTLEGSLRTHPRVVIGAKLFGNPFYEPPDVYFNRSRRSAERERFDLRVSRLPADPSRHPTS